MTDGDAIFKAILAEPDDDLHRLALADWLDDTREKPHWAEFIRHQLAIAAYYHSGGKTGGDSTCGDLLNSEVRRKTERRYSTLLKKFQTCWLYHGWPDYAHMTPNGYDHYRRYAMIWRRGLPHELHTTPHSWYANAHTIMANLPIGMVECHIPSMVRSGMIFRGSGDGDIPTTEWVNFGIGPPCGPTCPDGTPSHLRGTHMHFGDHGDDIESCNGKGRDYLSAKMLEYGRKRAKLVTPERYIA